MDVKVSNESGKQYWMEGTGCLRTEGENRPSRPTHIVLAWTYRGRETGCNVETLKDIAYCLREPKGGGSMPNILYESDWFRWI